MKKSELIDAVAATANVTNADAERTLEAFTAVARTALKEGKRVSLPDFGTFTTKERAARQGRNPGTGQPIQIAAKTVTSFKASRALADHVA
jgi:DNA-binding protein HU-beta